jgi:three-Cys-motif partner protein
VTDANERALLEEQVGSWTQAKLSVLRRYIGYKDERGRGGGFLGATVGARERNYIDGHASYGHDRVSGVFRRNGTPLIALEAAITAKDGRTSRFDHLWFVELDKAKADELTANVRRAGGAARAEVLNRDINVVIPEILTKVHPLAPTLCVLDPYDPGDLRFETIRRIADHARDERRHKIEQFVNLPIGLMHRGVNLKEKRTLTAQAKGRLRELIGGSGWEPLLDAYGAGAGPRWPEVFEAMKAEFIANVRGLGYTYVQVMDVLPPHPYYSLVFASDHPRAETIMGSSMRDWQRDPTNPQLTLDWSR